MYEMYPAQWGARAESAPATSTERPRRRARRQHQVAPRVIRTAVR
ncbi:hypothetical protein [Microlunatus sp. Y2014]